MKEPVMCGGGTLTKEGITREPTKGRGFPARDLLWVPCGAPSLGRGTGKTDGLKRPTRAPSQTPDERGGAAGHHGEKGNGRMEGKTPKKWRSPPPPLTPCATATTRPVNRMPSVKTGQSRRENRKNVK
jgi:hypothetical protein